MAHTEGELAFLGVLSSMSLCAGASSFRYCFAQQEIDPEADLSFRQTIPFPVEKKEEVFFASNLILWDLPISIPSLSSHCLQS